jgi:hypothetical protein
MTSPSAPRTTSAHLTRRSALGLAGAGALTALVGTPGHAARASRTVPLPDGIRPEGVTSGPGTTYYVGSLADGRLVTGDLRDGEPSRLLWAGATGRQLRGLQWDARSGLVWAAGNVGTAGYVWAVDGATGAVVSEVPVAGAVFLNDLVVTEDAVVVTDSRVDRLTVVALDPATGLATGAAPTFVVLGGAWPVGDGAAINANGIRELPDGALVLNNSRVGGLWQTDVTTGATAAIPVSGGRPLTGGDGLELVGTTLYDVRGSGDAEVSVLTLSPGASGWTAAWDGTRRHRSLDVPSTATAAGGSLWAVNARFGVASPGTASYWITRLPL